MATQSTLQDFENIKSNWGKINFSRVYREEIGTASLKAIEPLVESISQKIDRTYKVNSVLSDRTLKQFVSIINNIVTLLNAIVSLKDDDFIVQKKRVHDDLINFNEQILNIWPQIAAIINDIDKNAEIEKNIEISEQLKYRSLEDAKEITKLKESLNDELKSFEERYKNDLFNKAELIKQEDAFEKDAIGFKKNSRQWFYGIIGTSFVLLLVLFLLFNHFCFELVCFDEVCTFNYEIICEGCNKSILYLEIFKAVVFRVFIISFLSYLLSICVRNYNANMHNYAVNKHKANSLSAALVLLDRAKTNEGNDQLMTQAANAIFSHQPTGFNSKNPENTTTTITEKIVENLKKN